jgi:oligopeptidase A
MKYCRNRALRETLYRANVSKASSGAFNNVGIVKELLALRQEKAQLLGYATYAELSLASKMAPSIAAVEAMHNELRAKCIDKAREELQTLASYAKSQGQSAPLAHWDIAYWYIDKKSKYIYALL